MANIDIFRIPVGARYKLLSPSSHPAHNPVNKFDFRAPTYDRNCPTTRPKMNYHQRLDRLVFTGWSKLGEDSIIDELHSLWLTEKCLMGNSHPVKLVATFLPIYMRNSWSTRATSHHLSVVQLCTWSNEMMALLLLLIQALHHGRVWTVPLLDLPKRYQYISSNKMEATTRAQGYSSLFRIPSERSWKRNMVIEGVEVCFACQGPKIGVPSCEEYVNFKVDQCLVIYSWSFILLGCLDGTSPVMIKQWD